MTTTSKRARGDGYIRRKVRKDGVVVFACCFKSDTNHHYATLPSLAKAKDWIAMKRNEKTQGILGVKPKEPDPDPILFKHLAAALVVARTLHANDLRKPWSKGMRSYVNGHLGSTLNPTFGERWAHEITTDELKTWLAAQLNRVKRATVKHYQRVLSMVFDYGVKARHLKSNPMDTIETVHVPTHEIKQGKVLTAEELRAILDAADREVLAARERRARGAREDLEMLDRLLVVALQNRAYVNVLAFGGLRQAEATRMTWKWVDLVGRRLNVIEAKTGTARADQEIPLASRARTALLELGERGPDDLVFRGWKRTDGKGHFGDGKKPLTSVNRMLKALCAKAEVSSRGLGNHSFRNTFASLLEAAGVRFSVVRNLLRHGRKSAPAGAAVWIITSGYISPEWKAMQAGLELLESSVYGAPVRQLRIAAL